jgi:hypothetical protein
LARLLTGFPVFVALLCGQPDLLAVICLYLSLLIVLAAGVTALCRGTLKLRFH